MNITPRIDTVFSAIIQEAFLIMLKSMIFSFTDASLNTL